MRRNYYALRRALFAAAAAIFLLSSVLIAANRRIRPVLQEYAVNRAKTTASEAVSSAVAEILENGGYSYADLAVITRDEVGNVLSVELNTAAANRIGAALTTALLDRLDEDRYTTVKFPLLDITGNALLMGRGPQVNVTMRQSGAITTQLGSEFSAAGINQTLHRVELRVSFRAVVMGIGLSDPVEIESTFPVSETVIVGVVPELYANITPSK